MMSEQGGQPREETGPLAGAGDPGRASTAMTVYILYLVGFVVGITVLIGVILAYVSKDSAPDWLKSHYIFQIHTFWKGLLFSAVSFLLIFVFIGWLGFLATAIWFIVRCVKGIQLAVRGEAVPVPATWTF